MIYNFTPNLRPIFKTLAETDIYFKETIIDLFRAVSFFVRNFLELLEIGRAHV